MAVGGMGEIYRARDSRLNREVAVKVLPARLAADAAALERFRREALAIAALSHPNIIAIFDVGETDGVHYVVTELLEGVSLRERLGNGPLGSSDAIKLMLQITDAIGAAHAGGIIHRDLKPENVFLTRSGGVKVLDFGLARSVDGGLEPSWTHAPTTTAPTIPGAILGTVGYLAPEQLTAGPLTPRADVFALGCLLYELLTGEVPFRRDSQMHSMVAVLHDPAPRLAARHTLQDRDLDAIVRACLEKDSARRPADASELHALLRRLAEGERVPLHLRRHQTAWRRTLVAITIGVAVAAVLFGVLRGRKQIDEGFDLRMSDVRGNAETRRLVELGLRADSAGNRTKAIELLEEAFRRESSPFPAAFLSSYSAAAGDPDLSKRWRNDAIRLLDSDTSAYGSLLVRFLVADRGEGSKELALARSALEIRPEAWRLRLAAAHIHFLQRDRDAALRELRQIDVRKPDDRRLMIVLSDRASLGDPDGAERDLLRSRLANRPPLRAYTEGRIAWSRGDATLARSHFERAAHAAAAEGSTGIEAESRILAGVACIRLGEWTDARHNLALAATRARHAALPHRRFEAAGLSAWCAYRAGDSYERDRKLEEAWGVSSNTSQRTALHLLAIRMGHAPVGNESAELIAGKAPPAPPVVSLIHAREALARGEPEAAMRDLLRARAEAIETTLFHEEAELLAAELGLPSSDLPLDPPYPNILRFTAILDRQRIPVGNGVEMQTAIRDRRGTSRANAPGVPPS